MMVKLAQAIAMMGFVAIAAAVANAQASQATSASVEQATEIARDAGMVTIREIELDDGKWEIKGRNQTAERRALHVDASSGRTLRSERDGDSVDRIVGVLGRGIQDCQMKAT